MTLAQIRSWVRDKLQDDQFSSTVIDAAANWFVNDLFMNTATALMEEHDTLYPATGDTTVDLPDDYQSVIKDGLYVTSPQTYALWQYYMPYNDFMKAFPGWESYTSHYLTNWTFYGSQIRFSAPLSADHTIPIDYLRQPTTMVNDTDICEVPDLYQELVVLGTLKRCMDTNEDYDEASQELANLEPLRVAFIKNEGRGGQSTGPIIMRSNRRGANVRQRRW